MPRSNRKKKKAKLLLAPALPAKASTDQPFADRRYTVVLNVLSARREGDPNLIEVAERKFVVDLLGETHADDDEAVQQRVHEDYRHLSPLKRTEELASELTDAVKAVRAMIPGEGYWGLSGVHPFTVSEGILKDLWRLRHSIDDMGMPYYIFAKAAAIYWAFDRKGYHVPLIADLACLDVFLQAFDMWCEADEQEWNVPMRQILTRVFSDEVDEAA